MSVRSIGLLAAVCLCGAAIFINHMPKDAASRQTTANMIELRTGFTNSGLGKDGKVHQFQDNSIYYATRLPSHCRILPAGTHYWVSLPTGKNGTLEFHRTTAQQAIEVCRAGK